MSPRATTSRTAQRRLTALQDSTRESLENALRAVLLTPDGRRVLLWLAYDVCGLLSGTLTDSTNVTLHAEGRRSVGIDVLRRVQAVAPDAYVLAVQEQIAAGREYELQRKAAESAAAEAAEPTETDDA